jgi:arylsulfatase
MPLTRRQFLKGSASAAALGATSRAMTSTAAAAALRPSPKPNILFLFSDQHHPSVLSAVGHPIVRTPHLQRLAEDGACFRNAYCASPLCVPSRTSTMVSRYSHATGIVKNLYEDLIGDQPNLPRTLRSAGYHTCHIGKTHLAAGTTDIARMERLGFSESLPTPGKIGGGEAKGPYIDYLRAKGVFEKFDADYRLRTTGREHSLCDARPSVLEVEDYFDQWISRKADDWLRSYRGEQPFYLSVNWPGPHALRDAPGRYATMYDPADMNPPIGDPMNLAPGPIKKRQSQTLAKMQGDCWRGVRASYYGMISLIDDGIGMMLRTLQERGLLENTLVIYASDHGEMLWDHGLVDKTLLYEGSVGVPLIMRYPREIPAQLRPKSFASLIDLAPTLLDFAGAPALPSAQGRSLMPVLRGETDNRDEVFAEMEMTRMVRRGDWKYICDPQWDIQQLFNLKKDPHELDNLIQKEAGVARELHARINAWLDATKA